MRNRQAGNLQKLKKLKTKLNKGIHNDFRQIFYRLYWGI